MTARTIKNSLTAMGVLTAMSVGGYVFAQGFGPLQQDPFGEEETTEPAQPLPAPKVTTEEKDGYRIITSNGIPNHVTGKFPQPGNPGRIQAQNYKFRMTLKPVLGKVTLLHHDVFGVAVNGIPFNPATNEFWNNNRAWNYDALSGKIYLGTDASNAHVQPGGIYHYHGLPTALLAMLAKKDRMVLTGYASDGFPIYSSYGHSAASDAKSPLKKLRSSYRLKEGNRPSGNAGPGGTYDGTFSADWEYVKDAGDLDECNGRTGVTPEYPKGTYYYVLTEEFPFVPRALHGTPDPSFNPNRPGRPGPMGNGMGANSPGMGGPGQGGPPQGGFGPGGPGPDGPDGGFGPPDDPEGWGPPPPGFGPPPPGFGPPPPGFGPPQ